MDIQGVLVPLVFLYWIGITIFIILLIRFLILSIKALKLYISNNS